MTQRREKPYEHKDAVEGVKQTKRDCQKCKKGKLVEYKWMVGCVFSQGKYEACNNPDCNYNKKM